MTQTRKWVAATVAVVVLVLAGGWFLLVSPKRSDAAELRAQTQQQEDANATLRTRLQMLRAQAEGLAEQRRRLARATAALPDDPRLPDLVRELTRNARRAGVDLVSIAPGLPVAVTASTDASSGATPTPSPSPSASSDSTATDTTTSSGSTAGTTGTEGTLAAVPLTLEVSGDYAPLERFLNLLEQVRRPLVVTGFTLGPAGASSSQTSGTTSSSSASAPVSSGDETLSITGKTFMLDRSAATSATSGSTTPAP